MTAEPVATAARPAGPGFRWRRPTLATGSYRRLAGMGCGVLSVALFSSFTLASRRGFASSLPLSDLAALRFGIGGALMLPVLLRYGFAGLGRRDLVALPALGGIGFALLAYAGFSLAPAAHASVLLHGTLPLTTFAILRLGKAPQTTNFRTVGLAVIAVGVAMMAYDSLRGASTRQLAGDLLLLLASLSWSAYGLWTRRLGLPPQQAAATVAVLSMACYLPIYALLPHHGLLEVPISELAAQAMAQGVLIGAVLVFVYTSAVAMLGPAATALFTAIVPVVATLAAVPLLGEHASRASLLGVGIVTLGLALSIRRRGPTPSVLARQA